ncbi:MAG: NifU family protein [Bacteroidales bacterium]
MEENKKEDLRTRVMDALEKVRPYLQADGGDIELVEVSDDNIVKVRLTGACNGCPFSMHTLKGGVEQALMKEVPEVAEVVSV